MMNTKVEKMRKGINNVKQREVVLYHVMSPISQKQLAEIKENGFFGPSQNALGGQSDGYYFFTVRKGAQHHIDTTQWDVGGGKDLYLVECEADLSNARYPEWKLDYEAMQDFLFDMIYEAAQKHVIKFDCVEIKAAKDKKLEISDKGKFSRIKGFSANDHSGLIEKTADFLYKRDSEFKKAYDELLKKVFSGKGENQELFAVKTSKKHKITKITKVETKTTSPQQNQVSQINKFFARYGRGKR